MWDLFKGEALRFRGWTAVLALGHLMALAFLTRMEDLAQQRVFAHTGFATLYGLLGLLLGIYQMGGYRRPSQWLNLLHRPLPRARIAAALVGAGMLQLIVVVMLPILLVAILQEATTARVVDLRHWMLPVSALLVAVCAYLAGAFCTLRGPVYAIAALPLLWWLPASNAYGFAMLAVELLVLGWLVALLLDAFRPDLSAPPRGAGAVAVALPMHMGAYALVMVLFVGVELAWIAQGSHPNNTATPPPGGHTAVQNLDPRGRLLAGLEGSQHPDTALLREKIERAEPGSMPLPLPRMPQRNELSNFRLAEFNDERRHVRWVFSHDDMRLHGYRLTDGSLHGKLGVGEAQAAFPAPVSAAWTRPVRPGDDLLLTSGDTLYKFDMEKQHIIPRLRVEPGEIVAAAAGVGQSLAVMSDQALYFYQPRRLDMTAQLTPKLRLAMPGKVGDLRGVEFIELEDGHLVSFLYSARSHGPTGPAPFQVMLRTRENGRVETIHQRALRFDYPALYRYRSWWISPALYALADAGRNLLAPPLPLDATEPAPIPRGMRCLAAVLALLSLVVAAWRTASTSLSVRGRLIWIVGSGLGGLPALVSLWVMVGRTTATAVETSQPPSSHPQRAATGTPVRRWRTLSGRHPRQHSPPTGK